MRSRAAASATAGLSANQVAELACEIQLELVPMAQYSGLILPGCSLAIQMQQGLKELSWVEVLLVSSLYHTLSG